MTKANILLHAADRIAVAIRDELAPYCERIEIAGSIRRRKSHIGDIELVLIPQMESSGLFGETERSRLDRKLRELCDARGPAGRAKLYQLKDGPKYKQFQIVRHAPLCLDLFIVQPETWGVALALRTGPTDFNKQLVSTVEKGGLLPNDLSIDECRIWRGRRKEIVGERKTPVVIEPGEALDTPEEEDVFHVIGGWIEPWMRRAGATPVNEQPAIERNVS